MNVKRKTTRVEIDAVNPESVLLVINSRDDGDIEVCLSPMNGSDNKEEDSKIESNFQKLFSVEQPALGESDDDCPEVSLDKCDHNDLHREGSEVPLTNKSQVSNEHPAGDTSTGSNTISNAKGAIDSIRPSLLNIMFRWNSQNI